MRTKIMQFIFILIGIICIAYGVLVLGTHSGTSFFIVWFVLGGIFIAFALMRRLQIPERVPGAVRIAGK